MQLYLDGDIQPPTKGGCTLTFDLTTVPTTADPTGTFARDEYYVGGSCMVSANFTEMALSEVLALFPNISGNFVQIPVGYSALNDAKALLLRPIVAGAVSSDDAEAIFLPKVFPKVKLNTQFSIDGQRIWQVDFTGLPYDPLTYDFRILGFGVTSITPLGS
jgi:hypothetical protein